LFQNSNPANFRDHDRSIPLEAFDALKRFDGVWFVNLSKRYLPRTSRTSEHLDSVDFMPFVEDFADTAAIIESLDLTIAIDGIIAHLAGALGKPVWLLVPFSPFWQWGARGNRSDWYPSMRIFRQEFFGDWRGVMDGVATALGQFMQERPVATDRASLTEAG
jgi:hypothetical protein